MHRTCVSRSILCLTLPLLLNACGGGGGSAANGVSSGVISDGASGIGLLSDPTVKVPELLVPDSITNVTVTLSKLDGTPVPAAIGSYSLPDSILVMKPFYPLAPRTTYELRIDGAKTAGDVLVQRTVSFTTVPNPRRARIQFETDQNGITGLWHYDYDENGHFSAITHYAGAGADGLWDSTDDIIDGYGTVESLVSTLNVIAHDAPGNDGVPYTADDPAVGAMRFNYDGNNHVLKWMNATAPGNDNTWLTSDDQFDVYQTYSYDDRQHLVQHIDYAEAGPDSLWQTEDDIPRSYEQYLYDDTTHRLATYYALDGPGTDGVWFSGSEHASEARRYYYDDNGDLAYRVDSAGPGPDGQWLTGDDDQAYRSYQYDSNHNQQKTVDFVSSGNDGQWYTADDSVGAWTKKQYDANKRLIRSVQYSGSGTDNTWFTEDDVLNQGTEWDYNADGTVAQMRSYSTDPGNYQMTAYSTYRYTEAGLLTEEVRYSGNGDDNTWFSADDQVDYRDRY